MVANELKSMTLGEAAAYRAGFQAGQRLEDSVVQQGAVLTRERVVDLVCTELWQRIATRNEWLEQALKGGCDVTATVLRAEIQLLVALEKDYVLLLSKED